MQEPQTGLTSPTCRTPPGQKSGHPPDSSRADLLHPGFDVTLLSNDTSTATPENEDCAPSSRSPPDASCAPFPHRSPRRSSANAACGGLQPPSARAAAKGQTFISCTAPCQEALPTNRTPFHVRGTRTFSNRISTRQSATWGWWVRLTRCPSDFVSPSCPIFLVRPAVSLGTSGGTTTARSSYGAPPIIAPQPKVISMQSNSGFLGRAR